MAELLTYNELCRKHAKEFSSFPHTFAFNKVQLAEAREKLGKNIVHIFAGLFIRTCDIDRYKDMMARHVAEMNEFLAHKENFIDALMYEMGNHEYIVTRDIGEALFALEIGELDNEKIEWVEEAIKRYLEKQKED